MKRMLTLGCGLLAAGWSPARGEFTFGHLYLSVLEPDACDFGGFQVIVDLDPATSAFDVLADSNDGLCVPNGLRFTPDGSRLLVLNAGHLLPDDGGWVQAFAPDGRSEVILETEDGLARPFGVNALAFDILGNLYIVNSQISTIVRFPRGLPPGFVFADSEDGILGRGALDFAPNGDLFYCSDPAWSISRVTPMGVGIPFDSPPAPPVSLAFDRYGNLFVATHGGLVLRYDGANAAQRHVLASGFFSPIGGTIALTVAPDGSVIYLAERNGNVYRIHPTRGTVIPFFDFDALGLNHPYPTGITVYAPQISGDISRNGQIDVIDAFEFFGCVSGPSPAVELPPQCRPADFDGDRDVDFEDFSRLQILISQSALRGG